MTGAKRLGLAGASLGSIGGLRFRVWGLGLLPTEGAGMSLYRLLLLLLLLLLLPAPPVDGAGRSP